MKQIFCPGIFAKILILLILSSCSGGPGAKGHGEAGRVYNIIGLANASGEGWSAEQLESLGAEEIASAYFDQGLSYQGSRFRTVSLAKLIRRFDPEGESDAVLLNCFDDYQGLLSLEDIRRYDLRLATRIQIRPQFVPPDWLNPLLVIVPDGSAAPFQERFLTANIRELRLTRLDAYYAPLNRIGESSPQAGEGLSAFKNNCLFCHSLMGVGGHKGISLLDSYAFSRAEGKKRFEKDFTAFHHKDNPDKQNVEQFVSEAQLQAIGHFLLQAQQSAAHSGVK